MKVFIKLVARVAEGIDKPEFWIFLEENVTLKDLLDKLNVEKGLKIDLDERSLVILINGRSVEFLGGANAKLKDLDKVVIMPLAAGG